MGEMEGQWMTTQAIQEKVLKEAVLGRDTQGAESREQRAENGDHRAERTSSIHTRTSLVMTAVVATSADIALPIEKLGSVRVSPII
jgi:hypothetical protein